VTQLGDASTDVARTRGAQPSRLKSVLQGDLDWITMKALEKDRRRRYGSATELAADLRRYLTMQPVLASPPKTTYRLRKFVRRHRVGVATAASLAGLVVAAAVITGVHASRVAHERDRANLEAAAARQVSDFLVGLFRVSDPSEARGSSLTAREILDKGAKDALETLQTQPELQSRLLATIGTVYTGLGSYRAAEPLLEQAVATLRRVRGNGSTQTLDAENELANVYWYRDRLADAEPLYNQVVTGRRQLLGPDHPDTLRVQYDLAALYFAQNRYTDSERLMMSTLQAQQRVLGETHPDTLLSLSNLGSLYHEQRRFAEAEPLRVKVLDGMRQNMGADHPATLTSMHNLATTYDRLDKWDEAERLYQMSITAKTRVFGVRHELTVLSVVSVAAMLVRRQEYASAERRLLDEATALAPLETADPKAATRLVRGFVSLYEAWGKPDEAALWRGRLPKS
jgi:non-specific serine/threonine protein kinase/serine/threonine-protein kinase